MLAAGAAIGTAPARAAEPLKRWALLASPEIEKTGLPDLLTADLSKQPGIELVERQQIAAVVKELTLSNVVGAGAVSDRLKLGRLLKADALVILLTRRADDQDFVSLVIADCAAGARLWSENIAAPEGKMQAACSAVAERVTRIRTRHSTGIRHVIGLSAFESKNLVHDHDYLQATLAQVLGSALTSVPGVAVIETEEAAAIGRELATAGGEVQRVVPVFVKGTFKVANEVRKKDLSLTVEVVLSSGDRQVAVMQRDKLALHDVPEFLGVVAARILKEVDSPEAQPLPVAAQFKELAARADSFSKVGDWELAAGLREAALLLDPANAAQRLSIMADYARMCEGPMDMPNPDAGLARRIAAYAGILSHFEHLIRNRLINIAQSIEQAEAHLVPRGPIDPGYPPYRRLAKEIDAVEQQRRQFLVEVYPRALSLPRPPGPPDALWEYRWRERFAWVLGNAVLTRFCGWAPETPDDLLFVEKTLTQVMPDCIETECSMTCFLRRGPTAQSEHRPGQFTDADWLRFLESLKASKHRVAQCYGRYGFLYWNWLKYRNKEPERLRPFLAEADAVIADFETIPYLPRSAQSRKNEWTYTAFTDLRGYIKEAVRPEKREPAQTPRTPREEQDTRDTGRLSFEPLKLQYRGQDGELHPVGDWRAYGGWSPLLGLVRCGNELDVMWNAGVILFMRKAGLLDEVVADAKPIFDSVKWDGSHLWVATRLAGLWVLDKSGKAVAKITQKDGLPPCDVGVLLEPVSEGRVCVVGSFGEHSRAWCAMVEESKGKFQVNVFHRATAVKPLAPTGTDIVFAPAWLHLYTPARGQLRSLLVGRYAPALEARTRPLQINLDTLQVSLFPLELGHADHRLSDSYFSRDGELLECSEFSVIHTPRPGTTLPDGMRYHDLCSTRPARGGLAKQLLLHDGSIYVPGERWCRIDPGTWREEALSGSLPGRYVGRCFGVSAHYGLIMWTWHNEFYRVTVQEKPTPPTEGAK